MGDEQDLKETTTKLEHVSQPGSNGAAKPRRNVVRMVRQRPLIAVGLVILLAAAITGGIIYYQVLQSRIYIEKSEIYAPVISLSPDFELAVMNKADLYERADYALAVCPCCGGIDKG